MILLHDDDATEKTLDELRREIEAVRDDHRRMIRSSVVGRYGEKIDIVEADEIHFGRKILEADVLQRAAVESQACGLLDQQNARFYSAIQIARAKELADMFRKHLQVRLTITVRDDDP